MMEITIRQAVKADCAQLMELVKELALFENALEKVTIQLAAFEKSGFGETPVYWAFVAEIDENIVGFALYYIRFSTWKGERMYLEDLLITEEWRGKGIGKLLFDRMIKEAKEKGMNGMTWQVLEWNTPAINFYRKYQASFDPKWINCSIEI